MMDKDKKAKAMAKRHQTGMEITPRERSEALDRRISDRNNNDKSLARASKATAAASAVKREPVAGSAAARRTSEADAAAKSRARNLGGGGVYKAPPTKTIGSNSSLQADRMAKEKAKSGTGIRSDIADLQAAAIGKPTRTTSSSSSNSVAVPPSPTNSHLNQLEADIAAKSKPQSNPSVVVARSRASANNHGPSIMAYSSDLEDRIAQKTGIFMSDEEKKAGGGISVNSKIHSSDDDTKEISGDFSSSTPRPGITHCARLDERIAYKTGIPLDDEKEGDVEKALVPVDNDGKKKKGIQAGESVSKIRFEKETALEKFKANHHDDINLGNTLDGGRNYYTDGSDIFGDDLEDEPDKLAVATAVKDDEEDAFIPSAVEYDPDAKPPMYRNRRFRLYGLLACALLVLAIATTIGLLLSSAPTYVDPDDWEDAPSQAPTSTRHGLGIQEQLALIVGNERLTDPDSPQHKALNWIVNDDPMQLQPEDGNLVQRFLLVTFYYSTHEETDWISCNAPVGEEDQFCFFKKLVGIEPAVYRDIPWVRWLSAPHECQWAGILCDELDQVRSIDLTGQQISSKLPIELSFLPFLQGINLSWNNFHGTIPKQYGSMQYLLTLELHFCSLTGNVPSDWPNAKNLQQLNLGANELTGTIPDLSSFRGMKGLFLFGNFLTGDLPDLSVMESLVYVRFQSNYLTGTIPTSLANLPSLRELWLQRNPLKGTLPSELGTNPSLYDLRVFKTEIEGTIPEEIWVDGLNRVDLYDNRLTGTLSPSVARLTELNTLRVQDNELTGPIPSGLASLHNLQRLRLENNYFDGTVPPALCEIRGPDQLYQLVADCLHFNDDEPFVECECCDICCTGKDTGECAIMETEDVVPEK